MMIYTNTHVNAHVHTHIQYRIKAMLEKDGQNMKWQQSRN